MTIIERIAKLSDQELARSVATVRRLDITGTPAQRQEIAPFMRPLEIEASRRRAASNTAVPRRITA